MLIFSIYLFMVRGRELCLCHGHNGATSATQTPTNGQVGHGPMRVVRLAAVVEADGGASAADDAGGCDRCWLGVAASRTAGGAVLARHGPRPTTTPAMTTTNLGWAERGHGEDPRSGQSGGKGGRHWEIKAAASCPWT